MGVPMDEYNFSPAQRLVAMELVKGLSNKEIANNLGIADGTVKIHLRAILLKVGVQNRTQCALRLFQFVLYNEREEAALAREFSGGQVLLTFNEVR